MRCKHNKDENCPRCKEEKLAAAVTRLCVAIIKGAEAASGKAATPPKPKSVPGGGGGGKGPDLKINAGGVSIGAGVPNPIAMR